MDQHCRGTRLSYKHILLAKLRAELLADWGTCQAGRRKGLLSSTSGLLRVLWPPPSPPRAATQEQRDYYLQQAQEEMNNMMD